MASHNQSYRADEDKGQAEEKAGQMKDPTAGHLSAAKEKVEAGKKKASGVMQRNAYVTITQCLQRPSSSPLSSSTYRPLSVSGATSVSTSHHEIATEHMLSQICILPQARRTTAELHLVKDVAIGEPSVGVDDRGVRRSTCPVLMMGVLTGPSPTRRWSRVGTQTTRLTAEDQQEREASCDFDGVG
ncbi:hypothetical protein E3N88_05541 [Mikania micrantha]|uniref:Uncharacterized protein n=1 Tax=Mikania micrantha TaxID=192012 RepID=A0A5N6PN38_9ASTR|nr:hypothetical protein E3N88_05541 [Mikania micrantha]